MIIQEWLRHAETQLRVTSSTPRLDAEVLLSDFLQVDRSWLFAHDEHQLSIEQIGILEKRISKRCNNTPLAYIRGFAEFYGRNFIVNRHVLVPRPESEAFIECLFNIAQTNRLPMRALDVGTGSGALAVSAKLELPTLEVHATDISTMALRIAQKNATMLGADVTFRQQNLLTGDAGKYDILLANLPYVPTTMMHPSIEKEPFRALYSGADGLGHYRRLFRQLRANRARYVLIESLSEQHDALRHIAESSGYSLSRTVGLVQVYTPD
jgi:release factor glutamine methyltransferase